MNIRLFLIGASYSCHAKFHNFRVSKLQSFKILRLHDYKIPNFRDSKIPRFQGFWVSKFPSFEVPKFRSLRISNCSNPKFRIQVLNFRKCWDTPLLKCSILWILRFPEIILVKNDLVCFFHVWSNSTRNKAGRVKKISDNRKIRKCN